MSGIYTVGTNVTPPNPHDDSGPPRRITWIVWIVILCGILLLTFFKNRMETPANSITQYRFEELLNSEQIAHATLLYDPQSALIEVVGTYYQSENGAKTQVPFRTRLRLTARLEERLLSLPQFEARQPNTALMAVIWSVLPIIIIAVLIWFFFFRQIKKISVQTKGKTTEQQDRYDTILAKWEDQARRMDAVLEKMERDTGIKK